jgi:hypothetical protein
MKTVDLSKIQKEAREAEQRRQAAVDNQIKLARKKVETARKEAAKEPVEKKRPVRHDIDEVFNPKEEERTQKYDVKSFSRPQAANNENIWKAGVFVLLIIIVGFFGYMKFFSGGETGEVLGEAAQEEKWYAIRLINNEEYYGQISDVSADPIVIKNVYYNYDQLNAKDGAAPPAEGEKIDTGKLRLIKRGKETHGPAGSMNLVRAQVVYMEEMGEDSKVLQAILDYEK